MTQQNAEVRARTSNSETLPKSIRNTLKHMNLVHFKDKQYEVATATTVEEPRRTGISRLRLYHCHAPDPDFRKPKLF